MKRLTKGIVLAELSFLEKNSETFVISFVFERNKLCLLHDHGTRCNINTVETLHETLNVIK